MCTYLWVYLYQAVATQQSKDFEECVNSNNFLEETNSTHQAYSRVSFEKGLLICYFLL